MAPNVLKFVLTLGWLGLLMTVMPSASLAEGVIVGDIQFISEKSGTEKVCFAMNRFCDPQVFSLEGGKPRIVIDIKDVHSWSGKPRVPVNGVLIMQVRTHFHRDQHKLRIVLDLTPSLDYTADPLYYQAEGLYCIAVVAGK
jgi:hypothetical protein